MLKPKKIKRLKGRWRVSLHMATPKNVCCTNPSDSKQCTYWNPPRILVWTLNHCNRKHSTSNESMHFTAQFSLQTHVLQCWVSINFWTYQLVLVLDLSLKLSYQPGLGIRVMGWFLARMRQAYTGCWDWDNLDMKLVLPQFPTTYTGRRLILPHVPTGQILVQGWHCFRSYQSGGFFDTKTSANLYIRVPACYLPDTSIFPTT